MNKTAHENLDITEAAEGQSRLTVGLGALCGSAMAHHNCKYAGEITASRVHICNANIAIYDNCEYTDKGGLIHRKHGIKTIEVRP